MYVGMYVCMCVCMYVCMYVCVCVYLCMYFLCMCVYICIFCAFVFLYVCMWVCMYFLCMCVCIIYVGMYVCMLTYVCMYVLLYLCILKEKSICPCAKRKDVWRAVDVYIHSYIISAQYGQLHIPAVLSPGWKLPVTFQHNVECYSVSLGKYDLNRIHLAQYGVHWRDF